jgi:D-aminoacyl-tRNA deacylase
MKLILASEKDPAGMNIVTRLLEFYDFEKTIDERHFKLSDDLSLEVITGEATEVDFLPLLADELIVASRHASEAGKPSLTVHAPGDIEKRELALASPQTIKSALIALKKESEALGLSCEVSLEATHHGPSKLGIPVTFVEIGSTLKEWQDKKAGEAVAHSLMKATTSIPKCINAVGLGGPHYAPRHTHITLNTDVGIGHILPKYVEFDECTVELAVMRTHCGVQLLALDWKGMNDEQRTVCLNLARRLKIPAKRSGDIV